MVDHERRWKRVAGVQQAELPPAAACVEREVGDRLVHRPEPGEVVVDEEAEHAVVGAGELADPDRERDRLQCTLGGIPLRLALRVGQVDVVGGAQFEAQLSAHDGDRPANQAGDVLAAEGGERVDGPQRGVDRPEQGGQRRLVISGPPAAVRRVRGDQPDSERAERLLRGREPVPWPRVRRAVATRRDLPDHPAADRFVQQLTERAAVDAEDLEALVEMVGQQEANDRVHLQGRVDLVDPGLDALDPDRGRGVDQPALPACGPGQPRRDRERARVVVDRVADGHRHRVDRQLERPPPGVDEPGAGQPQLSCEQQGRRRDRARDRADPVAVGKSEQLGSEAVERGGDDVRLGHCLCEVGKCLLGVVAGLARHRVGVVSGLLGDQPVVDRALQRGRGAGCEQRAAVDGMHRGRHVLAGASFEVHRPELPAVDARRGRRIQRDLPLQPQRAPTAATSR